jgi:hypothetical protein
MKDPETDPKRHLPPLLTMHTNDARDGLWMTCECGWMTAAVAIPSDEDAREASGMLLVEAKAHWADAHGADFPTVR